MIHDLLVSGVTVFPGRQHFEFVPGINVVVGGNDSGKSHLLKLCYTVAKWSADGGENPCRKNGRRSSGSEKT